MSSTFPSAEPAYLLGTRAWDLGPWRSSAERGWIYKMDASVGQVMVELHAPGQGSVVCTAPQLHAEELQALHRVLSCPAVTRHYALRLECLVSRQTQQVLCLCLLCTHPQRLIKTLDDGSRSCCAMEESLSALVRTCWPSMSRWCWPPVVFPEAGVERMEVVRETAEESSREWSLSAARDRWHALEDSLPLPILLEETLDLGTSPWELHPEEGMLHLQETSAQSRASACLHLRGGLLPRQWYAWETQEQLSVLCSGPPGPILLVLPTSQLAAWKDSVQRIGGRHVLWMAHGREVADCTRADLERADLVITTLHLLHTSKSYAAMVHAALGGRARTRTALTAWSRQPKHTEPVLESIRWHRVVVPALESCKDLKHVRLFRSHALWLPSSPSSFWEPRAVPEEQTLHALFQRDHVPHHPDLARCILKAASI